MQISNQYKTQALKALAAVGFVAVLVFGAWGVIQVARMVPNLGSAIYSAAVSLTSIFKPAERLEITIPSANVTSGEPFTLTWEHINKRSEGTYTLTFTCAEGLEMQTPGANGMYQKVFCNTPFNLSNANDSLTLIPVSSKARFLDVGLKLQFTRTVDGKVSAETETAITVTNDKFVTTPVVTPSTGTTGTPKPVTPTRTPGTPSTNTYVLTQGGRVSDPNGRANLTVQILETGVINTSTNVFTSTSVIRKTDRGAVRFVITNTGTKTVDNWYFNAVIPTFPMHIFSSPVQPQLGPGDSVEYTLGFDKADGSTTGGVLTINVDPANSIWNEINENDNIAKVIFTITN